MARNPQYMPPAKRRIASWIERAHRAGRPLNISAVRRERPDLLKEAFSIRPFWGWRRAIEAAGCTYDEIAWHLEETVACEICGLEQASLVTHLRTQHGFAAGEYQLEFPGAFVMSEALRAASRRSRRLIMPHWEPLWTPEYVLDRISHFHENRISVNHTTLLDTEPSLLPFVSAYFDGLPSALIAAGIDPAEVRLIAEAQFLDPEEVVERIRARRAEQQPMNPKALRTADRPLLEAAVRHFGSWRKALSVVGVSPSKVFETQRHVKEQWLRRARRVAGLAGEEHRRELERLHRDVGALVRLHYGGWRSLAEHLGVPARALLRKPPYSKAGVSEELRRRQRDADSLGVTDIGREDSQLYLAVIRYFGTFEECYQELGLPLPPTPSMFRKAEQDPEWLLEQIWGWIPAGTLPKAVPAGSLAGPAHLARISRKHFGSWEEGLARAGLMDRPGIAALLYAHPTCVRRDLERVAAGEAFDEERTEALFRHAAKLYGSILDGLLATGLDRDAALRLRTSAEPYPCGQRVCEEIQSRRRSALPVSHEALSQGECKDLPLLGSAKLIFGTWTSALHAADMPGADDTSVDLAASLVERNQDADDNGRRLESAGLDTTPKEMARLIAEPQILDPDEVVERIRLRQTKKQPVNAGAVSSNEDELYRAGAKHFGSWARALRAAGVSPPELGKVRQYPEDALLRRVRRVARLTGEKHARELERLHENLNSLVELRYGGWRSLAEQLGLPARALLRIGYYSKTDAIEALQSRQREGKSLGISEIQSEDSPLYHTVIRQFGTFEECYEELGFPLPPTPSAFRKAEQHPERLLEQIQKRIPDGTLPETVPVKRLAGAARLARLSQKHFGSWEEGLARAGMMDRSGIAAYLYTHPKSVRRDLVRITSGEVFDEERTEALFRHAAKLYGSVLDGLLETGLSRQAALRLRTLVEEPYTSGDRVCEEIRRRRRSELPVSHQAVGTGKHRDLPLLRSGKLIFGNWTSALQAADTPSALAGRSSTDRSGDD